MPINNPVSETLADLHAGQYTPPSRADPSSWWRDYMTRRDPSFTDPGPLPAASRPPGVTTADPAITAPITTTAAPQIMPAGAPIAVGEGTGLPSITQAQWSTPDTIGPAYGRALQQAGLLPPHLVYNAETRIWE